MDGTIEQVGQLYVLRFERYLSHPVDAVWDALTEPEQVKEWLADLLIERYPGGRHILNFQNTEEQIAGRVITWDPPHVFEHTFGDDANGVVRWELTPHGEGCLLKLSHTVYETPELANFASGWHTHLELLEAVLEGAPQPWDWDRWHTHKARYADRVSNELGATSDGIPSSDTNQ